MLSGASTPKAHPSKSAAAKSVPQTGAAPLREIRQIPIDGERANKVYEIHTAIGFPAVVEFPEPFLEPPACGDCGDKGLFHIDINANNYFTIKPGKYPGAQPNGSVISPDEFVTTVNVRLQSKLTLTVVVRLTDREKADPRVVFTLPNRGGDKAYLQAQVDAARHELERTYAEKTELASQQLFLQAIAEPHQCVPASLHERKSDVVLEVRELCRFGNSLYVKFTVENRGRALLDIGEVSLLAARGQEALGADTHDYMPQRTVEFQGVSTGVVGFAITKEDSAPKAFVLRISERGGSNREITSSSFGF